MQRKNKPDKPATRLSREVSRREQLDMHGLLAQWEASPADVAKVIVGVGDVAFVVRFTAEVRKRFGVEAVEQLAGLLEHAAGQDPAEVVVEVSGGVVNAIYGRHVERAVLIDWDNINDEDPGKPVDFGVTDMDDMPEATVEQYERA